jgi:hypothetical protein
MSRVLSLHPSLKRREVDGFVFPLGVYPVGPAAPKAGYVLEFEPADSGDSFLSGSGNWGSTWSGQAGGGWSEDADEPGSEDAGDDADEMWPDRFLFDVLVPATRLRALWRAVATLLPGRVYPILDVLGNDAYREIDPYIAFELVGIERLYDGVRWYEDWLFEDGMVGFGAMSLDPFVYVFLDEHKILTIRVPIDMKERVEKLLAAMDLEEIDEISGPDAAEHEHTSVLDTGPDSAGMSAQEIIEHLRDHWMLQLNIDPARNVNDNEEELGLTAWRCFVRCYPDAQASDEVYYAEVLLVAGSLMDAERFAFEAVSARAAESGATFPAGRSEAPWSELDLVGHDRITPEELARALEGQPESATLDEPGVRQVLWFDATDDEPGHPSAQSRPHPQGEPRTSSGAGHPADPDNDAGEGTGDDADSTRDADSEPGAPPSPSAD